jgi:predicted ATPase|tara:strand:+ start:864 stop:1097 length:234 start_codon:yes stop_codon:yes gene_type:complete
MTEFNEEVTRQQLKLDAEEWGKQLKYYHFNNGIRTIEFNNGNKLVENVADDKVQVIKSKSNKSLVDRMLTTFRGGKW